METLQQFVVTSLKFIGLSLIISAILVSIILVITALTTIGDFYKNMREKD